MELVWLCWNIFLVADCLRTEEPTGFFLVADTAKTWLVQADLKPPSTYVTDEPELIHCLSEHLVCEWVILDDESGAFPLRGPLLASVVCKSHESRSWL
jgi:hypothetical protein